MPNPKLETYKNKATNTVYDLTDADAQGKLTAILDGTTIDSFADVESALADKVDVVAGKGLSTNDYDNTAKGIVDNIQANVIANTQLIADTVGWSGKNKFKVDASSKTDHDVAITVNSDGSVKANGLASADAGLVLNTTGMSIPAGNYIASTGAEYQDGVMVRFYATRGGQSVVLADVNGTEAPITIQSGDVVNAYLSVSNGKTVSNKMFYPMLRDASILDSTYEPYFGSTAFPRSEQAVLGARQFIDYNKWKTSEFTRATGVWENNGVTITATGADAYVNAGYQIPVKEGIEYKLSWKETENKYGTIYIFPNGSGTGLVSVDNRNAKELRYTPTSGVNYVTFRFGVGNANDTISYKDVMFTLASDNDTNYSDYSGMTNRELTDMLSLTEHTVTGTTDANGLLVASNIPHHPIIYCFGAPSGGGNCYAEARPGGGGIAFYLHNAGTKLANTEVTVHYYDFVK